MEYLDYEYYLEKSDIKEVSEKDFNKFYNKSKQLIEVLSNARLSVDVFNNLCGIKKDFIQKAFVAEIDYIIDNGGIDFINEDSDIHNYSVGNIRYSTKSGNSSIRRFFPELAIKYLSFAGVINRRVSN